MRVIFFPVRLDSISNATSNTLSSLLYSAKVAVLLLASLTLIACDKAEKAPDKPTETDLSDSSKSSGETTDNEQSETSDKPVVEGNGNSETHPSEPKAEINLSANDVSLLFPPPKSVDDMAFQISVADLSPATFPDPVFSSMESIATSTAGQVVNKEERVFQIDFSSVTTQDTIDFTGKKAAWHVTGIRIDPSAPGLSEDTRKKFGTIPQIRLILSPVTNVKDKPLVHDFALHLIYSFLEPQPEGCVGDAACRVPDKEKFKAIVDDIKLLKTDLAAGNIGGTKVLTDGDLGVHPGLANPQTRIDTKKRIQVFLDKHLSFKNLGAIAVMGLHEGVEPWIFLAMQFDPKAGKFVAVPSPAISHPPEVLKKIQDAKAQKDMKKIMEATGELNTAQMLSFVTEEAVFPEPVTSNVNPTPCLASAENCQNVSTAELFIKDTDAAKRRVRSVVDVIADASQSHFFNTDCVSCHTETHREIELLGTKSFEGIADNVLPKEAWNIRNFGWFRSEFVQTEVLPTVTRRTQKETEEVVICVNDIDNCFDNVGFHPNK